MANKAYKFRIYPSTEQKAFLAKCFGCSRFVYNHFLRLATDIYAESKKQLRYKDMAGLLTKLKLEDTYSWLSEVNSQSLQQTLKNLESAYVAFFKKITAFPRFKSRSDRQSFRVPQHFSITDDGKLKLPKMASIPIVMHRTMEGEMKSVTISKTPTGKYYASILVEYERQPTPLNGDKIGIDLGLKDFAITSTGDKYPNPKFLRRSQKRLKRLQRSLSRKVKGSENRDKARLLVASTLELIAQQRQDMHHKLSFKLTCDNQAIAVEDLNIKGMVKNHKLARAISDAGWGQFVSMLSYKGELYGCELRRIDRFFPSSKRCSNCGHIKENLTLDIREWDCTECSVHHDRDVNAAKNILKFSQSTVGSTETNTPDEPVARQGNQEGYFLGAGSLTPCG